MPITQAPIPSAGPYYISARTPYLSLVASRNPNYAGPRPHRFDSIEYTIGNTLEQIRQRVESGVSDYTVTLPPTAHPELAQLYGPDSPAAARGLQRWFSDAGSCISYLALNTERSLFATPNMRKAVNFAIDRAAMVALNGPTSSRTTDQYLPPGTPGFSDISVYPDQPDIARARQLANWQPGDPLRRVVLYHGLSAPGPKRGSSTCRTRAPERWSTVRVSPRSPTALRRRHLLPLRHHPATPTTAATASATSSAGSTLCRSESHRPEPWAGADENPPGKLLGRVSALCAVESGAGTSHLPETAGGDKARARRESRPGRQSRAPLVRTRSQQALSCLRVQR